MFCIGASKTSVLCCGAIQLAASRAMRLPATGPFHSMPPSRGALQPAAWRAMRSRATTAFDCTLPSQKKNGIIIVIPIAAARTEEIPIAAAGGQTWTETELWWSFLCNNVHSSEAPHIASGALCASPLCTSPWLLAALPPVLALLSLGQLQAPLLLL